MDTKILLCVLLSAQALYLVTGQCRRWQGTVQSRKQVAPVSETAMHALFKRMIKKYNHNKACTCGTWPDNFNVQLGYLADFRTDGAFAGPFTGVGVSWHVPISGTVPCQKRGVLKLKPPPLAKTLVINLCLNNPTEWSFHLGDDAANNGWGGGGSANWNVAEVHSLNAATLVYRAYDGTNKEKLLINYFRKSVSSGPYTIKVKKPSTKGDYVGINNYEGVDADIYDDLLFMWDTMYFGINRVVSSSSRQGTGLCFINIRWETT